MRRVPYLEPFVPGAMAPAAAAAAASSHSSSCSSSSTHLSQVWAWSLSFLVSGHAPTCRHDGSPWTQQDLRVRIRDELLPRAAFLMVRGDWEWLCQCFRFRHFRVAPAAAAGVPAGVPASSCCCCCWRHFQSESFCWLCDATHTGPLTYYNVMPDAAHRATQLTHTRS